MMLKSTSKESPQQLYIQALAVRSLTAKNYRKTLNGFQRFLAEQGVEKSVSQEVMRRWLEDRSRVWPFVKLAPRARLVDRFLEWMVEKGTLANNPFAELRKEYGQRSTAPIVRALLSPNFADALEALRPAPRFGSFLGPVMRDHVALMQTLGYRYDTQEERLLQVGPISSAATGTLWSVSDGVNPRMGEHTIRPSAGVRLSPGWQNPHCRAGSHRSNQ